MKKYLLAAALTALAAPAYAGNLTYDNYAWTGIGSIHITSPHDITGGAGPITLYSKGVPVVTDAWRMDANSYLTTSGVDGVLPFNLASLATPLPGVPKDLTQDQLDGIEWLVRNGDNAVGADHQGAYQVAIWTVEYSKTAQPFSYDPLGPTIDADVANLVAHAEGPQAAPPAGYTMHFLEPIDPSVSQTLVYETLGTMTVTGSVPEMSTWTMATAGFGLIGLMAMRQRKTSRYAVV